MSGGGGGGVLWACRADEEGVLPVTSSISLALICSGNQESLRILSILPK